MQYNRKLQISTAGTRKAMLWPKSEIMWSEFAEKLKTPVRGTETLEQYLVLPKSQQDELKDVGGFVGGTFEGDRRKAAGVVGRDLITLEDLREYPCLSFEQGTYNSFYFAEEVLSTYEYKRLIKANDRATLLNLMVGLNGYTLCSGIICEELNGSDYCAVKLDSDEVMTIGYLARKGTTISKLGQKYLEEIAKYKDKALR